MSNKQLNVVVLIGGPSPEHEVSLATGRVILSALDKTKYTPRPVTITKEGKWLLPLAAPKLLNGKELTEECLVPVETGRALDQLKSERSADVVFIAMHGRFGEDGIVQGFLELAGVAYTGSDVLASALAMDKLKSYEFFVFHGLKVPRYIHFSHKQWGSKTKKITNEMKEELEFPLVVKPSNCGSSVGVTI